jgi:hypothetical protein
VKFDRRFISVAAVNFMALGIAFIVLIGRWNRDGVISGESRNQISKLAGSESVQLIAQISCKEN